MEFVFNNKLYKFGIGKLSGLTIIPCYWQMSMGEYATHYYFDWVYWSFQLTIRIPRRVKVRINEKK